MTAHVEFVFDFISPYAYLGWHRTRRELAPLGVTIEPIPVLFAAMLNANETKGPAEIPAKRIYTWKHVVRLAHEQGLTIQPPPAHPFNPLLPLRVVAAIDGIEERTRAVGALFSAAWDHGEAITEPEQVTHWLDVAGLPGADWVSAATSDEARQALRDNTDRAMKRGVFGVPSCLVDDEVFWGQDSVPHVAAYLRGEDPAAGAADRWLNLPVGASRPASR